MSATSKETSERQPPDVPALLRALCRSRVDFVVTGSAAAMLHGVPLVPGDLDITPALGADNLERLAGVLVAIEARQDPGAPFGRWERQDDGEHRWVDLEPTSDDVSARTNWKPSPCQPASFDHLLHSRHGALDIVPAVSGTYDDLIVRAVPLDIDDHRVWVESVEDLLATLTVPRRSKDRDRVARLREMQRAAPRLDPSAGS